MKKKISGAMLLLMSITTILFSSCTPNPPVVEDEVKVGDLLLNTMLANPGGQTGSGWMQLIDGFTQKTLSNKNAVQVGYGQIPVCHGNDIYTFPSYGAQGDENVLIKWKRTKGKLTQVATMPLPLNSTPRNIAFVSDTKAYLISTIGKFFVFNPQTMKMTDKEIDFAPYAAEGVGYPLFGAPFVHEDHLYITLNQTDLTFMPKTEPQIDLAVINVKTDSVERIIYEKESGIGIGTYTYGVQTFIDEKGDMYFICTGAYGMLPKYKTGILRIKKGETEFDPTYNWVLNDHPIEGEDGKTVWLLQAIYTVNGKLYGTMEVPAYRENPEAPNWFVDKSLISAEIDIYARTIKKLPIPTTSSYGGAVERYKDLIIFTVNGKNDMGLYTYNLLTGETSPEAVVKVTGMPTFIHYFKD